MAFSEEFNKKMVCFDGIDIVFDENGSRFLSMRKVQWVNIGDDPDKDKAKLEIRKYTIGKDGEEIMGKGVAFLTEDGPHNLANELVKNGYGSTKEILSALRHRKDFESTVEHFYGDGHDVNDGNYVDMRSILLSDDEIEEVS